MADYTDESALSVAGWLRKEAVRLRRTSWESPLMLAEELYMILSRVPETGTGPIQIAPAADGSDVIIDLPPMEALGLAIYDLDFYGIEGLQAAPSRIEVTQDDGQRVVTNTIEHITRTVVPGQVISGTGDTYKMKLFPMGPNGIGYNVNGVKQLQITSNSTIPADSWQLVFRLSKLYIHQILTEDTNGSVTRSTQVEVVPGYPKHWVQFPVWM